MGKHILTINAGSSSIKFALYNGQEEEILKGAVEKIGWPNSDFYVEGQNQTDGVISVEAVNHVAALNIVAD